MTQDPGCFWHGEEPIPPGAYLTCGECGHCYVNPFDLLDAHLAMAAEIGIDSNPASPDEITFCPLCSHDF